MKVFRTNLWDRVKQVDYVLLVCSLLLTVMSLATLWGGREEFGMGRLYMQVAMTVMGLAVMLFLATVDYEQIVDKLYIAFFLGSVFLLAATLLFGISEGSNQSWITILEYGDTVISIQPSEFVKASFILTFSKHLDLVKGRINHPKSVLGLMLHAGIIIGLVLLSGDLGVALVYLGIVLLMLYCAGLSVYYFLAAAVIAVLVFPYLWEFLADYQKERILVGFNPEIDPYGKGMQPLMSRKAITSGGIWGRGIGSGSYFKSLPAADTDFIFATYCEKFGFVGGFLMIATYVVMVVRLFYLARAARRGYGSYICVGVAAMLIVQTAENVGMSLAMLPVVGITLPFMSAGGSSMLALYITMGMIHSIHVHSSKYFYDNPTG